MAPASFMAPASAPVTYLYGADVPERLRDRLPSVTYAFMRFRKPSEQAPKVFGTGSRIMGAINQLASS